MSKDQHSWTFQSYRYSDSDRQQDPKDRRVKLSEFERGSAERPCNETGNSLSDYAQLDTLEGEIGSRQGPFMLIWL